MRKEFDSVMNQEMDVDMSNLEKQVNKKEGDTEDDDSSEEDGEGESSEDETSVDEELRWKKRIMLR